MSDTGWNVRTCEVCGWVLHGLNVRCPCNQSDQARMLAAREFVRKAVDRLNSFVTAKEFEAAVRKAAEALPPFTPIKDLEQ